MEGFLQDFWAKWLLGARVTLLPLAILLATIWLVALSRPLPVFLFGEAPQVVYGVLALACFTGCLFLNKSRAGERALLQAERTLAIKRTEAGLKW